MGGNIDVIKEFIGNFNWDGPKAFALLGVIAFGIMRKWLLVALVLLVVVVGTNIEKYVLFEYQFNDVTVGASWIVYVVGGVVITLAAFFSLFGK